MAVLLVGCTRGPRNFHNENDRLRAENLQLQRAVEDLELALARKDDELGVMRQRLEGASPVPGAQTPALTTIELGRYSGPVDTDGDGRDDVVRLYLKTLDQHGRTLPVEGTASVALVLLGDGDEQPPSAIADKAYDAQALRDSHRSGFTGTHYTFELPLNNAPDGVSSLAARVTLTDAATGAKHEAVEAYTVTR